MSLSLIKFHGLVIVRHYPVVTDEGGEVGGLEIMQNLYVLSTVHSIAGREAAPREDAQLQELCDRLVLGGSWAQKHKVSSQAVKILSTDTHHLGYI